MRQPPEGLQSQFMIRCDLNHAISRQCIGTDAGNDSLYNAALMPTKRVSIGRFSRSFVSAKTKAT